MNDENHENKKSNTKYENDQESKESSDVNGSSILEEGSLFGKALYIYINDIGSLSKGLPIIHKSLANELKSQNKLYKEFINNHAVKTTDGNENHLIIPPDRVDEFQRITSELGVLANSIITIPKSYIVTLISIYDAFTRKIIKLVFNKKPELLNSCEKSFTIKNLIEIGSIDEAKDILVDEEIDEVGRESHIKQFKWMESKFSMELRKDLPIWSKFIEISERRNLFVHTDGIVTDQYLNVCKDNGVNLSEIARGTELTCDLGYFEKAYETIFEMGFKLCQVLWRKYVPEEINSADSSASEIAYDLLESEKYELVKIILDFVLHTMKKHPYKDYDELRRIMVINFAQSYKWRGDEKTATSIISSEDWSATKEKFRLAKEVLLENYTEAYNLMLIIGDKSTELPKEFYRKWPLFKRIKNEVEFQKTFESIFHESYNQVDTNSLSIVQNF